MSKRKTATVSTSEGTTEIEATPTELAMLAAGVPMTINAAGKLEPVASKPAHIVVDASGPTPVAVPPAVDFSDIEALEHAGERSGSPLLIKTLCLVAREVRLLRAGVKA